MSKLQKELRRYISEIQETPEGKLLARLRCPAEFIGFQGHFPGNPILPGVCKVQAVLVLLEERHQQPARLVKIISTKFTAPVTVDEEVCIECEESVEGPDETLVRAKMVRGTQTTATLCLKVRYGNSLAKGSKHAS